MCTEGTNVPVLLPHYCDGGRGGGVSPAHGISFQQNTRLLNLWIGTNKHSTFFFNFFFPFKIMFTLPLTHLNTCSMIRAFVSFVWFKTNLIIIFILGV